MRCSDVERLCFRLLTQLFSTAICGAEDSVDQGAVPLLGKFHGFVNGRMFGNFENKQLIQTESENVPKIDIYL